MLSRICIHSPASKVVVFSGAEPVDKAIADYVEGYVLKDADLGYLVDVLESVGKRREPEVTLDLPRALTSVGTARRFVTEKLIEWKLEQILDDALLVASELVANAITHAGSPCRIRLSLNPPTLRIDAIDTGAGTPEPQLGNSTREDGRGLRLVAALTVAWGIEALSGEGKLRRRGKAGVGRARATRIRTLLDRGHCARNQFTAACPSRTTSRTLLNEDHVLWFSASWLRARRCRRCHTTGPATRNTPISRALDRLSRLATRS